LTASAGASGAAADELRELLVFIVRAGSALSAAGNPVFSVQERLTRVAHAYGARHAVISAFPTFLIVTMGSGEPAAVELTSVTVAPRLDQIAGLDHLIREAESGRVSPAEGLRRLDAIYEMRPRFGRLQSIAGYSVLTLGLCLILQPSGPDVAAAALLGAFVGWLRSVAGHQPPVRALMPLIAAFTVSALSALAIRHDVLDLGLGAMVAALVVFLPGSTLTTAVLELAEGQAVSGSSRLVAGAMQLALLAFGIIAGIQAVGVSARAVFSGSSAVLGEWAPWLGVLVFAMGVVVANSAPPRAFPGMLLVLYAAWIGQVAGNFIFGGYVSAFVGALVMTPVAAWVARLPSAMPRYALFLPGFWLLVPGALGLIGLTQVAGDSRAAGTDDLIATVVSLFAVAVGVLCGTLLFDGVTATRRYVGEFRPRWPRA
jgi:uncharacterized membrane protein YjjP (DUF1212 family)